MGFKIGEKEIGLNEPVFIIAELSANHMNDFDIAVKTIEAMVIQLLLIAIMNISRLNKELYGTDRFFIICMRMHTCHGIGNQNSKR